MIFNSESYISPPNYKHTRKKQELIDAKEMPYANYRGLLGLSREILSWIGDKEMANEEAKKLMSDPVYVKMMCRLCRVSHVIERDGGQRYNFQIEIN